MTTFTTNTDLNARGRQIGKTRKAAETQFWRLLSGLPALFARRPVDLAEELAKVARREDARRAVDHLLR